MKVALSGPFNDGLDYLFTSEMCLSPKQYIGCRVAVKLRNRPAIGIIVAVADHSNLSIDKLKSVDGLIDEKPVISQTLLNLLVWIAKYYHCHLYTALNTGLPTLFMQGKHYEVEVVKTYLPSISVLSVQMEMLSKNATKQRSLLQLLKQYPEGLSAVELKHSNIQKTTIDSAITKGWLTLNESEVSLEKNLQPQGVHFKLAKAQQNAIAQIIHYMNTFQVLLCHGVTGSGKTEVYIQAIQSVLAQGQQALVLVPEISLTPQTLSRFKARFETPVSCMHSKMTDKERLQNWQWIAEGKAGVMISTRSGVFTQFKSLGIIILDEEHDTSFKQQSGVRYHARDVAIMRAKMENIPIVLGSATPALETLQHAQSGRYQWLRLTERAGESKPCHHYLIDMRQGAIHAGLSQQLLDKMKVHLEAGNQALIFINRRGYAPTLMCHDCGWVSMCQRCDAPYTLHHSPQRLCCHHCGASVPIVTHCEACNSEEVSPVGVGTERIEDYLKNYFKSKSIVRLDRSNTSKKGELGSALSRIHRGHADIIIGTQMIAKGHHFSNVTMVGIVNVDGGLFSGDFRAIEKMAQLIVQVSGRAGREDKQGEVYLQTYHPEHYLLDKLLKEGYIAFSQAVLEERVIAHWPPFGYLVVLRAESKVLQEAINLLEIMKNLMPETLKHQVSCYGPLPGLRSKTAGFYRQMLLFKSDIRQPLHQLIDLIQYEMSKHKLKTARWTIDVDPQEMM